MTWHILGWLTLASQLGAAGFCVAWLSAHHKVPVTWERKLPAPKALVDEAWLSRGSDFVGYV